MPLVAAIPAVIGAGASIYAANQANKGLQRGIDAQQQATQQALDLQRQQFNQVRQDQAPFRQGGYAGLDAILADYGLLPQQQAGGPDYEAYVAQNPDIAAEGARVIASNPDMIGDLNSDGKVDTTDYGVYHARTFGDRAVPTVQGAGQTQTAEQRLQEQIGPEPTFAPRQDYTRPGYVAPDVSLNAFQASPDYQFRLNEGNRNLNAAWAARGALGSGAAGKAFLDYGQNTAASEYDKFFGRQLGLTDRQNTYNQNAFESDRGFDEQARTYDNSFQASRYDTNRAYDTSRADTRTNDLFRLVNAGQGAVNATGQAGQNYANAAQNQLNTNANVQGNAYGQMGMNQAALAGQLAGYGQNIFSNWQTPKPGPTTWSQSWGGGS